MDDSVKHMHDDGMDKGANLQRGSVTHLGIERNLEDCDEDGHVKRTGTTFTAAAHIITAVIGAGVLSLAWATAQLGWIAGPIAQLMFAAITLYCSFLLCDCYRMCYEWPGPFVGKRNYTYTTAVRNYLGTKYVLFCGIIQHLNLVSTSVGYTVTSGQALAAVYRAHCYHENPEASSLDKVSGETPCYPTINKYMVIFGCMQLVFIQLPDMDRIWWLSVIAAVMSFVYATIGLGLSIGKTTESDPGGPDRGTVGGVKDGSDDDFYGKNWDVLLALGNIAFAFSFNFILVEISDTIRAPDENKKMKKASAISIFVTTFYYLTIGCIAYSAYGNGAPGNLITGFGFYNPWWLVMLANLAIVIHLIGGYQVWTQPFLGMVEENVERWAAHSPGLHRFLQAGISFRLPGVGTVQLSVFRLVWRTIYVCLATLIACLAPFFNDIVGIMGSLGFWPLTVFLPIELHIAQRGIKRFSLQWTLMQCLSAFCFCISVGAMIGAIAGIYIDTRGYWIWHASY